MPEAEAQINQAQYGIFFDGTGNNYQVDTKFDDDTYEPTNVAKLFELYAAGGDNIGKQYVNGIGTRDIDLNKSGDEADYSNIEMAFGLGIQRRIEEAILGIQQFLEPFSGINTLLLDVFGFSRGAASARILVNEVHRLSKERPDCWHGSKIIVRFVGLFDTVGSIGIAGHGKNAGFNLNVHPKAALNVFQLCAYNEHRKYFPLSSLKDGQGGLPPNFAEKILLGSHSDIGGGYGDQENTIYLDSQSILFGGKIDTREHQRTERVRKQIEKWREQWRPYLADKWKSEDGELEIQERPPQKNGPEGQPNSHKQLVRYIWHRKVDKRLSHVALRLMFREAKNNDLPLSKLEKLANASSSLSYDVPDALLNYFQAAENDENLFASPHTDLYSKFVHHSHQFRAPIGGTGLINANATKGLVREILFNDPKKGLRG